MFDSAQVQQRVKFSGAAVGIVAKGTMSVDEQRIRFYFNKPSEMSRVHYDFSAIASIASSTLV